MNYLFFSKILAGFKKCKNEIKLFEKWQKSILLSAVMVSFASINSFSSNALVTFNITNAFFVIDELIGISKIKAKILTIRQICSIKSIKYAISGIILAVLSIAQISVRGKKSNDIIFVIN